MKKLISVFTITLFSLVLIGCSSTSDIDDGIYYLLTPPEDLSDYQVDIIKDGIVTEAEYVQAVNDHSLCIQQDGHDADEPIWDDDGLRYSFGMSYQGYENQPEKELEAALDSQQESYDRCQMEYSSFVERYWLYSQKPTGAAWDTQYQKYEECLIEQGVYGISSTMTDSEVVEKIMTFSQDIQEKAFGECVYKFWILYYE